ncbi:cold shock domain-containing protein [Candidatus Gracilibacteria bacterium]|nr:cold shock domain-containing protein [Candidatus Gracilibacteria bacterium]
MGIQESGTIKVLRLKEDYGFGFIAKDNGEDIFFHSTKCTGGFREFMDIYNKRKSGDKNIKVTFNVLNGQRGPMAFNVSIAK